MKEFSRAQRVSNAIQKELATLLRFEAKDERLKQITISAVKITRDLAYAKIYVTVLDEKQKQGVVDAANKAAAFLRTLLAKKIQLRSIPSLQFVYDESFAQGQRMSKLIDEALAEEKPKHDDHE